MKRHFSMRTHSLHFLLLLSLLMLGNNVFAQIGKNGKTSLSVRDVVGNYHIDASFLSDTINFIASLNAMDNGDNTLMSSYCNEIIRRANDMKQSLKYDYLNEEGRIWLDERTFIDDYVVYEGLIDTLISAAQRRDHYYMAREQERLRNEELQRQREAEAAEARRLEMLQSEQTRLKKRIAQQNEEISRECNPRTTKHSLRIPEYKNLYLAYQNVFRSYNLTLEDNSASYLNQLKELDMMQRHMLDSTLCDDNYTSRIQNFQKRLREATGADYPDIIRSYNKHFDIATVAPNFKTVPEYYQYVRQLDSIHHVQLYYLDVVVLRKVIDKNSMKNILPYETTYANPIRSYVKTLSWYDLTPKFTTEKDAEKCIQTLNEFIDLQKVYLTAFERLDLMAQRADTIYQLSRGELVDIRASYKKLENPGDKTPTFRHSKDAGDYIAHLDNFEQVQRHYFQVIKLRNTISGLASHIYNDASSSNALKRYYRQVCKRTEFAPSFTTDSTGKLFLKELEQHIEFQHLCIADIKQLDTILYNEVEINAYKTSHPNIYAVYKQVYNSYKMETISNEEEFARYGELLVAIRQLQHIIIDILRSNDAKEIDIRMRSIRDIGQMKQLLKLD